MIEKFGVVLKDSARTVVTFGVVAVASWLVLTAVPVPEWYITITSSIVAFWFGTKSNNGNGH